jgi:hypothetical protein
MSARERGKRRGGKVADSKKAAGPGDCLEPLGKTESHGGCVPQQPQRAVVLECLLKMVPALVDGVMAGLAPQGDGANLMAASGGEAASEMWKIRTEGRLRFLPGFNDVWLDGIHYDLRERTKARLCIQYLVENKAFDAGSALHLIKEIDPYVRKHGRFRRSLDIKIDHYFQDQRGKLLKLRQDLIRLVEGERRYFLKVR